MDVAFETLDRRKIKIKYPQYTIKIQNKKLKLLLILMAVISYVS